MLNNVVINKLYVSVIAILFFFVLFDFLYLLGNKVLAYGVVFLSIIPFFILFFDQKLVRRSFPTQSFLIAIYLFVHIYILSLSIFSDVYLFNSMWNGDSIRLHYPMVESIIFGNFWSYLFDFNSYLSVTGRITHSFLALFWWWWSQIFGGDFTSFMLMSFVVNTVLVLASGLIARDTVLKATMNGSFANLSLFMIIFSPFILAWSFMPMKEPLLVLLMVLLFRSVVLKNMYLFVLVTILVFFERLYFVYVIGLVFILLGSVSTHFKILVISICSTGLLLLIPIEKFLALYDWINLYNETRVEEGASQAGSGTTGDLARLLFSPNPASVLFGKGIKENYFYLIHFLLTPLYLYMIYLLVRLKNRVSVFLILFFIANFMLFPDAYRQKITVLIPFISIFYPIYLANLRRKSTIGWQL